MIFKKFFIAITIICLAATHMPSSAGGRMGQESVWAADSLWYHSVNSADTTKIDVLYFVSTDILSAKDSRGNVSWQSLLAPADVQAMTGEIDWVAKNMFYDDFTLTAPLYHQFSFDAISQLDSIAFGVVYANVRREACEAFDYYIAHQNNGRPFILAGFSQGAMLTLDILKHMTDNQFDRMIACYTLGYRVSADDLRHPHIKPAKGEADRGVVVSFNSVQTLDAIWPFVTNGAATCINPVNWTTGNTPATFTFAGTTNQVHVDQQNNVLVVKTDKPSFFHDYYKGATFFLDAGVNPDNLHHWDLLFYSHIIHDNALKRANNSITNK